MGLDLIQPVIAVPAEKSQDQCYPWMWLEGEIRSITESLPWSHEWTGTYGGRPFGRLRARNGQLIAPIQHIQRFLYSCQYMRIDITWTVPQLFEAIVQICRHNQVVDGYIDIEAYLPITQRDQPMAGHGIYNPKVRQGQVGIQIWMLAEYLGQGALERGIRCYLSPVPRPGQPPAGVKLGTYFLARHWKENATLAGYDEVIFTYEDKWGEVSLADASAAELIVKLKGEPNVCRIVPNHHGILGGITRHIACEILSRDFGQVIQQTPISWKTLVGEQVVGMVVVGTATLVVPVCSIFNPEGPVSYPIGNGQPHPLMLELGHRIRTVFAKGHNANYHIPNLFAPIGP